MQVWKFVGADFPDNSQLHTLHLSFLREGLLIADINLASVIRDILDTCRRFAGLVERWGGDVLPELLMEGINGEEVGKMVKERAQAVQEINDVRFFLLPMIAHQLTPILRHCMSFLLISLVLSWTRKIRALLIQISPLQMVEVLYLERYARLKSHE